MDLSSATSWWIVAGVLVAAELATGTFYLLMLALGAVAAAVAAHLGVVFNGQLLAAALVGGGAVAAWHLQRGKQEPALPAGANRDVNLDIGGTVQVAAWDAEGNAQVQYRGANWSVRYVGSGAPAPGTFVIHAIDGNRLLLQQRAPNSL
jgi:membrane protein implicated in regulation of membrane protease activity